MQISDLLLKIDGSDLSKCMEELSSCSNLTRTQIFYISCWWCGKVPKVARPIISKLSRRTISKPINVIKK